MSAMRVITFVIAPLFSVGLTQPDTISDPDAQAVYALTIPLAWHGDRPVVLVNETEPIERMTECIDRIIRSEPDWIAVAHDLVQQSGRVQVLPVVPILVQRISRAALAADDERLLRAQGGGIWQQLPGAMNFIAVSAVGFDAAKTKALVYLRSRAQGELVRLSAQGGKWVVERHGSCAWVS